VRVALDCARAASEEMPGPAGLTALPAHAAGTTARKMITKRRKVPTKFVLRERAFRRRDRKIVLPAGLSNGNRQIFLTFADPLYNRPTMSTLDLHALPGGNVVVEGIHDLEHGKVSVAALLVSIGAPRLRRSGIAIAPALRHPEARLYAMLHRQHGDGAHARYNAMLRILASFERSLESVG
jgi:hypothetical protein